jgi:hypothetical protein
MKIQRYTITRDQLITSDFKPIVYLPAQCTVLEVSVEGEEIALYVEQFETNELYPRKIAFITYGLIHDDIIREDLVYHSSITYNNKKYFVYLNEYRIQVLPVTNIIN